MSTHVVTGVVDSAFNKQKTSRAGKDFTINYIVVDGIEVSTGFKATHSKGEMVSIGVEQKYGEWQETGPSVAGLPPATALTPKVAKGNFGGGGAKAPARTFPVDKHDGQMSIIRQNSMNRAVEIVAKWSDLGLFKAKTEDEYLKKLIEVALNVTDFNSGQDIMQLQAAQTANLAINGE